MVMKYCATARGLYIYIDIVPDVPDTSGESKNNIGAAFGGPIILVWPILFILPPEVSETSGTMSI